MTVEAATYIDDLDVSLPNATSDYVLEGDDHLRLLKAVLKATFAGITGAITATQDEINKLDGVTVTTAEINSLAGITGVIETRLAAAEGVIPATTKMLFMQNAAPTGWTFVSSNNDRVILNTSTVGEGGDASGSWTISGLTGGSHVHGLGSHTHDAGSFVATVSGVGTDSGSAQTVGTSGSKTVSGTSGAASGDTDAETVTISSDGTWRPLYVKCITCSKD